MLIIRSFDYNGSLLPLKIFNNNNELKLTNNKSQGNLKVSSKDKLIIQRGYWFKQEVEIENINNTLIISPPKIMNNLFLLSVLSIILLAIFGSNNEILLMSFLIMPILYLLMMTYYFIFRRNSYFTIYLK